MTSLSFATLGLAEPILRALAAQNLHTPTPIQAGAIPALLAGHDLLGIAQTGTGKTAAFALPILQHLAAEPRPPRPPGHACADPGADARTGAADRRQPSAAYGRSSRSRTCVILGGVGRRPQVRAHAARPRHRRRHAGPHPRPDEHEHLLLDQVTHFVLDEADRMLDLGFIRDIRTIVAALPQQRQSMLFSATMPAEVGKLADGFLRDPVRVEVDAARSRTPDKIDQHVLFRADAGRSAPLLIDLLQDPAMDTRDRLHPHQARRQQGGRASARPRRSRPRRIHGNK